MDLFSNTTTQESLLPLAARLRPTSLDEYVGQQHLLGEGRPLRIAIERQLWHSMIFWGPPGVGKTSLAQTLAQGGDAHLQTLSAVMAGVKELRAAVNDAKERWASYGQRTLLFIDEIHRFNKNQQDALLPFVEDGSVILIGATTENPSFELNNALLSRCRVYRLRALTEDDLRQLLYRALASDQSGIRQSVSMAPDAESALLSAADGDARRLLNLVEICSDLANTVQSNTHVITLAEINEALSADVRRFDKGGDQFYEQISALHKAVRGSSPDGALYWCMRMLDGGCDPFYIARRVVRMAVEDIGNADPRGLQLALNAWETHERLGSPEGELAIAQAVLYLASAPKSNAAYSAFKQAKRLVESTPSYDVPMHLRNAPTKLMQQEGYGMEYRYAHDEPEGYAAGENYFPEALANEQFYFPVERGLEVKIAEKLKRLRERDTLSEVRRYVKE